MTDIPRLGKQPPRYTFFLNPYADARFTRCPKCGGRTRQRKLPLVIHVDGTGMISLNKTCRFCPGCDLLIARKDEIEAQLAHHLRTRALEAIGNDYLVIGTLDRPDWQRGVSGTVTTGETIEALHDFKDVVQFKPAGGWGKDGPCGRLP
jgi:hypothetical protein